MVPFTFLQVSGTVPGTWYHRTINIIPPGTWTQPETPVKERKKEGKKEDHLLFLD